MSLNKVFIPLVLTLSFDPKAKEEVLGGLMLSLTPLGPYRIWYCVSLLPCVIG